MPSPRICPRRRFTTGTDVGGVVKPDITVVQESMLIPGMVARGRVDVGLMVTSEARRFAPKVEGVVVLEPPFESLHLYHYVHVKHRDLIPALTKALQELNNSGRSEMILREE